jgi:hypothetical protein
MTPSQARASVGATWRDRLEEEIMNNDARRRWLGGEAVLGGLLLLLGILVLLGQALELDVGEVG